MRKGIIAGIVGGAALILSPFAACGPSFSFSEKEMTAAVEGTWNVTIPANGATPASEITMKLAQSSHPVRADIGLVESAQACGTRSLVKNAGACADVTEMPLEVTFVATAPLDGETWKNIEGSFRVPGTDFQRGMLSVQLDQRVLLATVDPAGVVTGASIVRGVGEDKPMENIDITMTRIAR